MKIHGPVYFVAAAALLPLANATPPASAFSHVDIQEKDSNNQRPHHRLLSNSRLLYNSDGGASDFIAMRNLQSELIDSVCAGFNPTDDIFLKGSSCSCERNDNELVVFCGKNICVEEESGELLSGDFNFRVTATFDENLDDMQVESVINRLFEGDYRTCFDYSQADEYNGNLVCILDKDIYGESPACEIFIGEEKCTSCRICPNDLVTRTEFDCSNIIEGEKLNECQDGSGLDGTVLRFLDLQAIPLDTEICAGFASVPSILGYSLSLVSAILVLFWS